MSDAEFLKGFEQCTIPKVDWTHEAHVRMAWLYLSQLPYDDALDKIRDGIQKYNRSLGNKTGYHETVTCFFARLISSRLKEGQTWEVFKLAHPELFRKSPPITAEYYSKERFQSSEARDGYLEPDLKRLS